MRTFLFSSACLFAAFVPFIFSPFPLYFMLKAWTYEWGISLSHRFVRVFSWNVLEPVMNHVLRGL